MNESRPKISIITSVLNAAGTIQRELDSIARQSYEEWELIVIDGGSTDGTVEILQKNDHLITYWESKPDRGIYHAWNKALDHVTGDWICFLGADDYLWNGDVLSEMAPHLEAQLGSYRLVYGSLNLVDTNGSVVFRLGEPWSEAGPRFRENLSIPHSGILHHKSLFEIHGRFDESFKIAGDYEFLLRELKANDAYFVEGVAVAGMQERGRSDRPENAVATLKEVLRAQRKHGLVKTPNWLSLRLFRERVRWLLTLLLGPKAALAVVNAYRSLMGKPKLPR